MDTPQGGFWKSYYNSGLAFLQTDSKSNAVRNN